MNRHLVVDISGHGFGHAGMTLPVLERLARSAAPLKLTIRTTLPQEWMTSRLGVPFSHCPPPRPEEDFGMLMTDAMRARTVESCSAYAGIHVDLSDRIDAAAQALADLAPSLLLSNIPYISLAGARRAGIPAVAYSTLNWADVFGAYCGGLSGADMLMRQMADAYTGAEMFIQPTPSMVMPSINNGCAVGPVARIGQDRKAELRARLEIADGGMVILMGLGGLPYPIDYQAWPDFGPHRVLVDCVTPPSRPDICRIEDTRFHYIDLVRSCDVMVVKSGYGTLVEAICNATPVVHIVRVGWPETAPLSTWLARHGQTVEIADQDARRGAILDKAKAAFDRPVTPVPAPGGIEQSAALITQFLR